MQYKTILEEHLLTHRGYIHIYLFILLVCVPAFASNHIHVHPTTQTCTWARLQSRTMCHSSTKTFYWSRSLVQFVIWRHNSHYYITCVSRDSAHIGQYKRCGGRDSTKYGPPKTDRLRSPLWFGLGHWRTRRLARHCGMLLVIVQVVILLYTFVGRRSRRW